MTHPTRLLVYGIALAILLVAQAALGGVVWQDYLLVPLNAVVVAFAAMGTYEQVLYTEDEDEKGRESA